MKRTPEIEARITELIATGCTYAEAAAAAGIHRDTFRVWRRDPAFSVIIKKAEAEACARMVATVTKAAEKTWQAAAWWLERKYPARYAKRDPSSPQDGKLRQKFVIEYEAVEAGKWHPDTAHELVELLAHNGAPADLVEHARKLKDEAERRWYEEPIEHEELDEPDEWPGR